jgi:hypothetical protein
MVSQKETVPEDLDKYEVMFAEGAWDAKLTIDSTTSFLLPDNFEIIKAQLSYSEDKETALSIDKVTLTRYTLNSTL